MRSLACLRKIRDVHASAIRRSPLITMPQNSWTNIYTSSTTLLFHLFFFTVAYSLDEVLYVWQIPKNESVGYEGELQLSQFDIMETAFRGLNFSRGNKSTNTFPSWTWTMTAFLHSAALSFGFNWGSR